MASAARRSSPAVVRLLGQILHLAVVSGLDPGREVVELAERRGGRNPGERKALVERRLFDEFRKQGHRTFNQPELSAATLRLRATATMAAISVSVMIPAELTHQMQ